MACLCVARRQAPVREECNGFWGWKGYNGLKQLGYLHEIVRKDGAVGDNLLPLCNRVAALVKRWLACLRAARRQVGTHQEAVSHLACAQRASREHLDYCLPVCVRRTGRAVATEPGTYLPARSAQAGNGLVQGVWAARPGNRNMYLPVRVRTQTGGLRQSRGYPYNNFYKEN